MIRILGIDPGYDRCGWAIVDVDERSHQQPQAIVFGTWQTDSTKSKIERFAEIQQDFLTILKDYHPQEVALEKLFFARNVSTALPVSEVRGMLISLSLQNNLSIFEYQPNEIKLTTCGYGQANKQQMLTMVTKLLNLEKIPKIDDTGDALAVALTHAVQRGSRLK